MFEPSLPMLAFTTLRPIGDPYFGLGSPAGLLYSYDGTGFRAGAGAAEADPAPASAHSPTPMTDAFFIPLLPWFQCTRTGIRCTPDPRIGKLELKARA